MNVSSQQSPTQSGNLLHNLVLFGRLLHFLGISVNPGRMITVVKALDYVEIGKRSDFYHALRCLLVRNKEELALFDQAFNLFWRKPADEWSVLDLPPSLARDQKNEVLIAEKSLWPNDSLAPDNRDGQTNEDAQTIVEVTRTYSNREKLRQKDFADLTKDELEAVKLMMSTLDWQLGQRKTRRQRPGRGRAIDMRRSLRRSLRHGGEILSWSKRKPKHRPRPLIIIADISGSMERYTRLLLHFVYSLARGLEQPVETFVFSTRLTHITRQLRDREVDQAMRRVSRSVHDWSGGTRIGEAFKRFNYDWARRVLGRGAVVILISDGWDRGDPALLAREMDRLRRSCYRLIWLNPLLGSEDYEPLTRGMQAALPYVDDFLPVHNLASLEDLARHLASLDNRQNRPQKILASAAGFRRV